MTWVVDWWTVLGWAGAGVGLVVAVWALWWDRARGRKRCPKCWYDMGGAKSGEGDALRCPECGQVVKRERELRRTRRRWRWAVPAAVVMVLGLVAGTMHDPAGVRSRGWVALVPTPVLVMVAPVENMIREGGAYEYVWNHPHRHAQLKELELRLKEGSVSGWEAEWIFRRLQDRFPEYFDRLLTYTLPRRFGGDVWIHTNQGPGIEECDAVTVVHLEFPSRTRIIGQTASGWHHMCGCSYENDTVMMLREPEVGSYILEREYYLPAPLSRNIGSGQVVPGDLVFRPSRRVLTLRTLIVVDETTILPLSPFDQPGLGDRLAAELDAIVAVDRDGRAWYLFKHPDSWITDPQRDAVFGFDVEVRLEGHALGSGSWCAVQPTRQSGFHVSPGHSHYLLLDNWFVPSRPLQEGDAVTIVLRGNDRVAADYGSDHDVYWDGAVVIPDVPVVPLDQLTNTLRLIPEPDRSMSVRAAPLAE